MFRFESLDIWKLSIEYGKEIFELCKEFPKNELFSFTPQLKRAAISISNNIAEGSGSLSPRSFKVFLNYSIRSAMETVSMLILSEKLNYSKQEKMQMLYEFAEKIVRKIRAFRKTL